MYNYNTVSGEAAIATGHAIQVYNAWFTLVVRIGDYHCLWSLVCKMLCLLEKNTIKTSVNQA